MARFWNIDFIAPLQLAIYTIVALANVRRLTWSSAAKLIAIEAFLGWLTLTVLDLMLSKPDAQGGLGPLLVFPVISIASAVASVAAIGLIRLAAGLLPVRRR